jgi:hypothetical protein
MEEGVVMTRQMMVERRGLGLRSDGVVVTQIEVVVIVDVTLVVVDMVVVVVVEMVMGQILLTVL